eukprot:CAMPEP_0197260398 /NCGR_PEP_ID=MMETSP1429-20130617/84013_1 /TAXON_ID=49237 /ORGANISM="Chaetoceros  sp., Strain UNC1202" /LENGTH=308 /DNA_ID=CAMNT_0042724637 /DNA_START=429 /DNA_END=1355 /DNA_ORIENTATION=-
MTDIAKDLPLLLKPPSSPQKPNGEDGDDEEDVDYEQVEALNRTQKLRLYIGRMRSAPICVELLLQSGIGKAVKKFIEKCKRKQENYFPEVFNVQRGSPRSTNNNEPLLPQMEDLLKRWMDLASSKGGNACLGKSPGTSPEDHAKDVKMMLQCTQWRDLFSALYRREQINIKTRGAKMRQIRQVLAADRPKMMAAKTKKVKYGNSRLANKLSGSHSGPSNSNVARGSGTSKLGQLKQQSKSHGAKIAGKSAASTSSSQGAFGNSVAASSGMKRKDSPTPNNNGRGTNKRVHSMGNGMKMKLPKYHRRNI